MAVSTIPATFNYRVPSGIASDLNSAYVAGTTSIHKYDGTTTNRPAGTGTVISAANATGAYVSQIAIVDGGSRTYYRIKSNGTWGAWDTVVLASQINDSGRLIIVSGSSTSVASSTNGATGTALASINLSKGIWLIITCARFAANTTGIRRTNLSEESGGMGVGIFWANYQNAGTTGNTFVYYARLLEVASPTTYYLNAGQNSGSAIATYGNIHAYRLSI